MSEPVAVIVRPVPTVTVTSEPPKAVAISTVQTGFSASRTELAAAQAAAEAAADTEVDAEQTRAEAAEAEAVKLTGEQTIAGKKTFTTEVVVPPAAHPTDAVRREELEAAVQAAVAGLVNHANVKYATAAALPTNTYLTGVLTGTALAALTIDGSAVTVGQRILVKNEVAEANNGIYVVTHAGGVAEAFVLTRAADMNENSQVAKAYVFAEAGNENKNGGFYVTAPGPFTLGTTAIPWGRLPGTGDLVAGEGINITGNTVAVSSSVGSGSALGLTSVQQGNKVLMGWLLAAAQRSTARASVLVIGDSIAEGVGAGYGRWTERMLTALRAKMPTPGVFGAGPANGVVGEGNNTGGLLGGGVGYVSGRYTVELGYPPTLTGTTAEGSNGLGHRSRILKSTGATWTVRRGFSTSVGVLLKRTGTDACTIAYAGETHTVAAGPSGYEYLKFTPPSSRGNYSVVVTQTAGEVEVCGTTFDDGDEEAGIGYWDCAKAGAKAADWVTAKGGSQQWLEAATAIGFSPSLVVIGLMTNDALAVNAATYKANLEALAALVEGKWPNASILLLGYWPRPTEEPLEGSWSSYFKAMEEVAAASKNRAYLPLERYLQALHPDQYGFLFSGTVHPDTQGHNWVGEIVASFVAPWGVSDASAYLHSATLVSPRLLAVSGAEQPTIEAGPSAGGLSGEWRWVRNKVLRAALRLNAEPESEPANGSQVDLVFYNNLGEYLKQFIRFYRNFAGFQVNAAKGKLAQIILGVEGNARWTLRKGEGETETGNAGGNLELKAYEDSGTLIGTAFFLQRSTARGTLALLNLNTTGKTSAQITTAVEAFGVVVRNGMQIVDETNALLLTYMGGEWWQQPIGVSGIPNLLLPIAVGGTPVVKENAAIGTAFKAYFERCIVPSTGHIKDISAWNGATVNGNSRAAILDVGETEAGHYTVLWESGEVAQTGASAWQSLGAPELAVKAGQHVLVALMNSGTTATYGKTATNFVANGNAQLPASYLPTPGGASPKLIGAHTFGSLSFGGAGAKIAEATVEETVAAIFMMIGRVA